MATATKNPVESSKQRQSVFLTINYPGILWVYEDNPRQDPKSFGDPLSDLNWGVEKDDATGEERVIRTTGDGLVYPLRNGWDTKERTVEVIPYTDKLRFPVPGGKIDERTVSGTEYRKLLIKGWKDKPATESLGNTAEAVFDGQAIEYVAKSCYRRSLGALGVFVRRRKENSPLGEFLIHCHPSTVLNDDPYEQLLQAGMENTGVDIGRKPMSEIDFFLMARRMIALRGERAKEADLFRIGVKRGAAQRAFALAKLDHLYPAVRIAERVLLPTPANTETVLYSPNGYLPLKAMRHQDLVRLKEGFKPNTKKNDAANRLRGGLSEKHLENYFREIVEGTAMKGASITQVLDAMRPSPVKLFQYLAIELDAGNTNVFSDMIGHAPQINKALEFLDFLPTEEEKKKEE